MPVQPSFDFIDVAPLAGARARLIAIFGAQRDEARADPISQLVQSLISSQTYDAASAAAFARVQARYRDWRALMHAPEAEVRALIADVTYAEKKAPYMIAALHAVQARNGCLSLENLAGAPIDRALAWLERLPGVGRKIAAAVLNFSTLRGRALVIDTHVLRVAQRLGWISTRAKTAENAYAPLMALIPADWDGDDLYELHWLMKRLGQNICTFAEASCGRCPLRGLCAHAR